MSGIFQRSQLPPTPVLMASGLGVVMVVTAAFTWPSRMSDALVVVGILLTGIVPTAWWMRRVDP